MCGLTKDRPASDSGHPSYFMLSSSLQCNMLCIMVSLARVAPPTTTTTMGTTSGTIYASRRTMEQEEQLNRLTDSFHMFHSMLTSRKGASAILDFY